MRGDRRVALPRRDRGGRDQHGLQCQGPDHQGSSGPGRGLQASHVDAEADPGTACPGRHHRQVSGGRAVLRDHGSPGGARDAPAKPEHEGRVQGHVGDVRDDGDDQRGPGVLQPAQHAGSGQDGQHGRRGDQADPQVSDGAGSYGRRGAERRDDRRRERQPERQHGCADSASQPEAVHALPDRCLPVAGAELPGDRGGRAVGEEDRDIDQRDERLGGDAKAAERCGA